MTAGIIPITNVPNWPNPPPGIMPACQKSLDDAGIKGSIAISPQGVHTPDVANTQGVFDAYVGSQSELDFHKAAKQTQLDDLIDNNFDLKAFIRDGTLTTITGAQVGNYLAQITNNYRTLRGQISAAATVAVVDAINLNSGWPANP